MEGEETGELTYGDIIVLEKDGSLGPRFPFTGTAVFGRGEQCDVRIKLPYISRTHAMLSTDENGEVMLENLTKKSESTLINGEPLDTRIALKNKDVFTCGDRRFQFEYSDICLKKTSDCLSGKKVKKANKKTATPKAALGVNNTVTNTAIDEIFKVVPQKSLATPIRKEIQRRNQMNAAQKSLPVGEVGNSGSNKDQIPLKKEVVVSQFAAKKTSINTPLRKSIEARKMDICDKPAAALSTPIRKEIQSRKVATSKNVSTLEKGIKKTLPTPLRNDITQRTTSVVKQKHSMPTPLKKSIAAADTGALNRLLKKPINTPTRHGINSHTASSLNHVATPDAKTKPTADFSKLPKSAAKFFAKQARNTEDSAGKKFVEDERTLLEREMQHSGLNPERYQDWSIDELEQRVRSICMKDDLVEALDDEEQCIDYDEHEVDSEDTFLSRLEAAATPLMEKYKGTHLEFQTPGTTPERNYEDYHVHWSYDEYGNREVANYEDHLCAHFKNAAEIEEEALTEEESPIEKMDEPVEQQIDNESMENEVDEEAIDVEQSIQEIAIPEEVEEAIDVELSIKEIATPDEVEEAIDVELSIKEIATPDEVEEAIDVELSIEEIATPDEEEVMDADEEYVSITPGPARRKSLRIATISKSTAKSAGKKSVKKAAREEMLNDEVSFLEMKVTDLRELLADAGLETKGKKAELVERLHEAPATHEEEEDDESSQHENATYSAMKVAELRSLLSAAGADTKGKKCELIERLIKIDSNTKRKAIIPELLKVNDLKNELSSRGIVCSGRKNELVDLLNAAIVDEEMQFQEISADGETFLKQGNELLWKRVSRQADDISFDAVVVGFLPATEEEPSELFRIRYVDDGQCEDLEVNELEVGIELYESTH